MATKVPTHDEIRETFTEVRDRLARSNLCPDATIDDYPIGRRERGKCRLQVERAQNKGYRTVRNTTSKYGRWCAPKKSTYSNSLIVVVRDWDDEHQHAWLSCGKPRAQHGGAHVSVQYANGVGVALAKCWRNDAPRREDVHYTSVIRTSNLGITAGGLRPENMTEERQERVLAADSTEECDAWDVWVQELETVRQLLLDVWKQANVPTVQPVVHNVF
jgi:hypothetical protein